MIKIKVRFEIFYEMPLYVVYRPNCKNEGIFPNHESDIVTSYISKLVNILTLGVFYV